MAFAVTAIADATNTTGATRTITVPVGGVPSGSLIVISVANSSDAAPNGGSVADAGSNTYTFQEGASNNNVQAEGFVAIYTAPCTTPLTSGQLITYTKPTSGTATRVNGVYVTGQATSGAVDTAASTSNFGSSTTPTVTGGTSAVADSLFIGAVTTEVTGATINQPGGSWTTIQSGTSTVELGNAYQVASGTGGLTYNPTFNSTHLWATVMLVISPPVSNAPFVQPNWPNPIRVVASITLASQVLGSAMMLLNGAPPVQAPFFKRDWPNTLSIKQPVQTQPLGANRLLNLYVGSYNFPARQQSWPVPAGARQPAQTQPLGTITSQFPEVVNYQVGHPLIYKREPLPWRPVTQPLGTFPALIPAPAPPFYQVSWPNPLIKTGLLRSVNSQPLGIPTAPIFPDTTIYQVGPPLIYKREPLPWRPVTQPLGTFTGLFPVIVVPTPFYQTDWPNPKGHRQPVQTQVLGSGIYIQDFNGVVVYVDGIEIHCYIDDVTVYSTSHACVNDPGWQGTTPSCAVPGWTSVNSSQGSTTVTINGTTITVWDDIPT